MSLCLSYTFLLCSLVLLFSSTQGAGQEKQANVEAELQRKIERLEKQNAVLRTSYTQAQKEVAETQAKFAEVRQRLEALGASSLGGNEERLVRAVADNEVLNSRLRKLEETAVRLSGAIIVYMKQAIAEEAESRAQVESFIRELDMLLGLRHQPLREGVGSLAEAKVISIDTQTGMIVLNVGAAQGLKVGMPIVIVRGEQTIGEALISDVRQDIAGGLIQKLESPTELVLVGDSVAVKTLDQ